MKKTKKRNHRMLSGAAGVLLAATLMLQGCIQIAPGNKNTNTNEDSGSQESPGYIYPTMNYQYKTDISKAEQYILTGMDGKYLLLANKKSVLGESYSPDRVVTLTCRTNGGKEVGLEERTAQALYAMLAEMAADGVTDISVTSGYRTYRYQQGLYNTYLQNESSTISEDAYAYFGKDYIQTEYLNKGKTKLSQSDAEKVVLSYSAYPGTSEHQTGLCIDFVTSTAGLTVAFENTEAFRWLSQNAYRFGFILRYPKDKVDITGYSYEPWHYRFVGREAATEIYFHGQCLEEFLGTTG